MLCPLLFGLAALFFLLRAVGREPRVPGILVSLPKDTFDRATCFGNGRHPTKQ